MQQRAGLLYLSVCNERILLILENNFWSVPTFDRNKTLYDDAEKILNFYSNGKIIPIELYVSKDNGFQYDTYICLVQKEFIVPEGKTFSWCCLDHLPKNLHPGIKTTINNSAVRVKIETILQLQKN